mmetsp:Transcript_11463/g.23850  ORF Transcript_11463/g.23850 Transcript_11463/m.23850 type:complete len:704 (+) Transcript_11463:1396-3507(+)
MTLQLAAAFLALTNGIIIASGTAFGLLNCLAGSDQLRALGAALVLKLTSETMQLIQLVISRFGLLLNLGQLGSDGIGLLLHVPQLLRLRNAHETGRILKSTRQCATTTHLVAIQSDGVQTILATHLITQLQGGANHRPAKDLLHCREGPLGAADHIHQGLHSRDLGILPGLGLQLVQGCAHNTAQTSFSHQRNNLPGDDVIFDQEVEDSAASGAFSGDAIGWWNLDVFQQGSEDVLVKTLLGDPGSDLVQGCTLWPGHSTFDLASQNSHLAFGLVLLFGLLLSVLEQGTPLLGPSFQAIRHFSEVLGDLLTQLLLQKQHLATALLGCLTCLVGSHLCLLQAVLRLFQLSSGFVLAQGALGHLVTQSLVALSHAGVLATATLLGKELASLSLADLLLLQQLGLPLTFCRKFWLLALQFVEQFFALALQASGLGFQFLFSLQCILGAHLLIVQLQLCSGQLIQLLSAQPFHLFVFGRHTLFLCGSALHLRLRILQRGAQLRGVALHLVKLCGDLTFLCLQTLDTLLCRAPVPIRQLVLQAAALLLQLLVFHQLSLLLFKTFDATGYSLDDLVRFLPSHRRVLKKLHGLCAAFVINASARNLLQQLQAPAIIHQRELGHLPLLHNVVGIGLGETAALQQVEDLIARGRLAVQRVVVLLCPNRPTNSNFILVNWHAPIDIVKDNLNEGRQNSRSGTLVQQGSSRLLS